MLGESFKEPWGRFEDSLVRDNHQILIDNKIFNIIKDSTLENSSKILDIGCGKGTFIHKLMQTFPEFDIYGVDKFFPFDNQKALGSIKYKQGDIEEGILYEDGIFQLCISKFVTMYLKNLGYHFREVARILEDKQEYLLVSYNPEYPLQKQRQYFGNNVSYGEKVENEITGSSVKVELLLHSPDDYYNAIQDAGFKILSETGIMHPNPNFKFAELNPFVHILRLQRNN